MTCLYGVFGNHRIPAALLCGLPAGHWPSSEALRSAASVSEGIADPDSRVGLVSVKVL